MEEVKTKEMELYQLKKKIAEHESRLKQQQVLFILQHYNSTLGVYIFTWLRCILCEYRRCMRRCVQRGTCAVRI